MSGLSTNWKTLEGREKRLGVLPIRSVTIEHDISMGSCIQGSFVAVIFDRHLTRLHVEHASSQLA